MKTNNQTSDEIIKFVKLPKKVGEIDASEPQQANSTDAGFDLRATSLKRQGDLLIYGTNIAIELPDKWMADIRPRSSIYKKDLILVNSPGTIDSGYRGELKVLFKLTGMGIEKDKSAKASASVYKVGDKIAQLICKRLDEYVFVEVDSLEESDRGEKGFGSSGTS